MTSTPFGLSVVTTARILGVLGRHPRVARAVLYGSRARGNFTEASDIDLALIGEVDLRERLQIMDELDDLLLPYMIDVSVLEQIDDAALRQHIDSVGKEFYCRASEKGLDDHDSSAPLVNG